MPSYFDGTTFQGFFFIKTDINGNEAYRFLIRKPDTILGFHYGLEAHKTHTGQYIFGGQIFKRTDHVTNVYLYKLNHQLDTTYIKEINHSDCSYVGAAIELSDNNYLLAGYKKSCQTGISNALMVKTDTDGNIIWQYEEQHPNNSAFYYPAAVNNGFYVTTPINNADQQTDSIIEVRKYDNNGQLKWTLPLGVPGQLNFSSVFTATRDGGGVQVLSTIDTSHSDPRAYNPSVIYRFDSNGHIIWQKWLVGTNVSSICEISNEALVFAQSSFGTYSDTIYWHNYRGQLFCLNNVGSMVWDKLYTHGVDTTDDSYFFDVTQSSDGGILATGQATQLGTQHNVAWLVKVDSNGCLNGDCPRLYSAVSEINDQNRFIVFPNPSTTQYTIALKETQFMHDYKSLTFSLYDLTGRIIKGQSIDEQVTTIQRGDASEGLYLWQISDGSRVLSKGKLIFK